MDKARKQRLLGVLALVVLFGAYVGWSERPRILLHYSGQASAPIAYSYSGSRAWKPSPGDPARPGPRVSGEAVRRQRLPDRLLLPSR